MSYTKTSAATMRKQLRRAAGAESPMPHLSELAEHFVREAGGPRTVARMLYQEYLRAPAGGVVRARILDLITRVWRFASEATAGPEELGLLSEEDLERELEERLGRLGKPDAEEEEAAAAADGGPVGPA